MPEVNQMHTGQQEIVILMSEGKRSIGRQRLKWTNNINIWTRETLAVNTIMSRNRVEWRSGVKTSTAPEHEPLVAHS
jgi:hypothetical protein